mgnify:CR=1 FL=1
MKKTQLNFVPYKETFKNTLNFSGTTTRRDYWTYLGTGFFLIPFVFGILATIPNLETIGTSLIRLNNLIHLVPLLAASVRRLRDSGQSPYWLIVILTTPILIFIGFDITLASLLGIIGFLFLLILLFRKSIRS